MTDAPTFHGYGLGALPDPEDPRDHLYSAYLDEHPEERVALAPPPKGVVEADKKVPILFQESLGSCVANEAAAHYAILLVKQGKKPVILSRLEIYRDARALDGTAPDKDWGTTGRSAAKTLAQKGACPETLWPYDISKFADPAPETCTRDDTNHNLIEYLSILDGQPDTLDLIKTSIAAGFPVGFSIPLYQNFHADKQGVIPMPSGRRVGGHRMLLVGYDDRTRRFKDRNSWNKEWGYNGYCFLPYDYIEQQGRDFRTYRLVEG